MSPRDPLTAALFGGEVTLVGCAVVFAGGDDIFSNVKAGMVHPLFVELKHCNFPGFPRPMVRSNGSLPRSVPVPAEAGPIHEA
jgi:hypothetical protein